MEEHVYRQLYELEDSHWWFRGRRAVIQAMLARTPLVGEPRILDAGCGTGRNLLEYARIGEVAGVDPSPEAVAFCHARGLDQVRQSGIEQLPYADAGFDLVTATDVLEHIAEDRAAARELRRVTKPGGRLLVTVPAYEWLWSQHDDSHQHQRRYTLRRLRATLTAGGWRPVLETYFNSILLAPIALVRAASGDKQRSDYDMAPGALNGALSVPMRTEAAFIARGGRLPAGVSIGMVCTAA
jgi:ubiquinone/menaquinone biosynthesis C-methylase UbiE